MQKWERECLVQALGREKWGGGLSVKQRREKRGKKVGHSGGGGDCGELKEEAKKGQRKRRGKREKFLREKLGKGVDLALDP